MVCVPAVSTKLAAEAPKRVQMHALKPRLACQRIEAAQDVASAVPSSVVKTRPLWVHTGPALS